MTSVLRVLCNDSCRGSFRIAIIAFESLIKLAMVLGYAADVRNLFGIPKFDTMEELDLIHRKSGDKRAYTKNTTE